jgi:hypothetical protein
MIAWQTSSNVQGISGIRITSPPPAMPAYSAIQPAWRPITSSTMTRSWLAAVVCSRSSASVAHSTALKKPNVNAVLDRSLSIVLGTPTTGMPCSWNCCATASEPSPPTQISPCDAQMLDRRLARRRSARVEFQPVVHADRGGEAALVGRAEDRAPLAENAGRVLVCERDVADRVGEPLVALEKPTTS